MSTRNHPRARRSPLTLISSHGESAALHRIEGCEGPMAVLLLHANGFCGLMYEPLVRRSSLSSLATVYALDMPGQGSSPKPRARGTGTPGALESYSFLALAAVDWLREQGLISSETFPLCALGHSGGGLAALRAEQERPGTFKALYLYEPVILPVKAAEAAREPSRRNNEEVSTSSPPPPPQLSSTPSLEAGARRRRRRFASREAALASLTKKPPFSLFDAECARIYAEEGMVSDDDEEGQGKGDDDEEGRRRTATASSTTSIAASVSLAASPEDEAAVYLEAGPLGFEAGKSLGAVAAPVLVAAGGGGGGGLGSQKTPILLHGPLARAAPRTASLLPRGKLEVYNGLGHLGPFEDPGFVGERAAEVFGKGAAKEEEESERWGSLPAEKEFEVFRSSSSGSGLSAKL